MHYWIVSISILLCFATSSPASAQARELPDAELGIGYRESGEKDFGFSVRTALADPEAIIAALPGALGVAPSTVRHKVDHEGDSLAAGGRVLLERQRALVFEDAIDLSLLRESLQRAGVKTLKIVIFVPNSPVTQAGPIEGMDMSSAIRYETTVDVASLTEPWVVRYGWEYRQAALPLAVLAGIVLLCEIALRRIRRRALTQAVRGNPSAILGCALVHQVAALAFVIAWSLALGYTIPIPWFTYVPQAWYGFGLVSSIIVPVVFGISYIVWTRRALFPVFQAFPERNWSRRELTMQGLWLGMIPLAIAPFLMIPLMGHLFLALREIEDIYVLLGLIPIPVIMGFVAGQLYFKSLGIVFRHVNLGPLHARSRVLAERCGLPPETPLALVYTFRSVLALLLFLPVSFFSTALQFVASVPLDARRVEHASDAELDCVVAREMVMARGMSKFALGFQMALYKVLIIGALFGIAAAGIAANGNDLIDIFRNPLFISLWIGLPVAFAAVGWLHVARSIRRRIRDAEREVLRIVNEPEAQIRVILREALTDYTPLDGWQRFALFFGEAPMSRARCIAAESGVSTERLATIRSEVEAMWNARPASDRLADEVIDVGSYRIRGVIWQSFGLVMLVGFPPLLAWQYGAHGPNWMPVWSLLLGAPPLLAAVVLAYHRRATCAGLRGLARKVQSSISKSQEPGAISVPVGSSMEVRSGGPRPGFLTGAGMLSVEPGRLRYDDGICETIMDVTRVQRIDFVSVHAPLYPRFAVRVAWTEEDVAAERAMLLLPLGAATGHAANVDALDLCRLLQDWREKSVENVQHRTTETAQGCAPVPTSRGVTADAKNAAASLLVLLMIAAMMLHWGLKSGKPLELTNHESALIAPLLLLGSVALIVVRSHLYKRQLRRYSLRSSKRGEVMGETL